MDFCGEMLAAPCFQVPPISLVSGLNFYLDLRAPLTDSGAVPLSLFGISHIPLNSLIHIAHESEFKNR